jgi:hypothetical protein
MIDLSDRHLVILSVIAPDWIAAWEAADEDGRRALELAPRFVVTPKFRYAAFPQYRRGEWTISLCQCPSDDVPDNWPYPPP